MFIPLLTETRRVSMLIENNYVLYLRPQRGRIFFFIPHTRPLQKPVLNSDKNNVNIYEYSPVVSIVYP